MNAGADHSQPRDGTVTWLERRRNRPASPDSTPSFSGERGASALEGLKILVADDEPDNASGFASLLRLRGATVYTAYDGDLAFQIARNQRPQMIFLDISMPHPDGWEICRRLRATDWGSEVPIVAVTALGSKGQLLKCSEVGFDYHVLKPVQFGTLEQLIDHALG